MDKDYYHLYDGNGNLAKLSTNIIGSIPNLSSTLLEYNSVIKYTYDNNKRITEYNNDNFKINYTYDSNDNITSKEYKLDTINHNLVNTFNKDDMLTKTIIDNDEINYEYDELGRLTSSNINGNNNYNYKYLSIGKRTSAIVKSVENNNHIYSYTYDNLYNITEVKDNNEIVKKYYYDNYNELIKEEDYTTNQKIEYNYDNSGNLLTKITTNMLTNVIIKTDTYQYSNNNWEDQLTSYNGNSITYDAIGNPLTIGSSIDMTWINGRSLSSYEDSSKELEVKYEYDVNGIRTSKIVGEVETKYYLENSNIIYEQRGTDLIYYLYDDSGILGFEYNGTRYYYIKNIQGDIIGILDENYNQIVTYEYDSWGKILSIKDNNNIEITDPTNIGIINPFRYRGYYYDEETKLYYLNSRYYNPEWARFLNADNYISTDTGLLGYNMYNYTNNNPIIFVDPMGHAIYIGLLVCIAAAGTIGVAYGINNKYQNEKAIKEINNVQKKYSNSVPNLSKSDEFKETLKNNATTVKLETKNMNQFQKLNYFVDNVKTGGKYDLKNTDEWRNTDIYYEGLIMEPQDIGNYHFGYIGRAIGYDIEFLTTGAGAYQLYSRTAKISWCFTTSNCDDPRDNYYIRLGAIAYDKDN